MGATQITIECDREIMGGAAVFVDTRVPAQTLLDYLESGETLAAFLADFPSVSRERVVAMLDAGAAVLAATVTARQVRILFDECVPRGLLRAFRAIDAVHVGELGWSGRRNGTLLAGTLAEGFAILSPSIETLHTSKSFRPRALALSSCIRYGIESLI